MPHRKLPTSVNRSVLGFTTAALLAGPFAATALAQVDTEIPPKPRADAILVEGVWVDPLTLEPIELATEMASEAAKTAAPVTKTVTKTVNDTVPTDGGSEPGGGGSAPVPGGAPAPGGSETGGGGGSGTTAPLPGGKKTTAGDSGATPIQEGRSTGGRQTRAGGRARAATATRAAATTEAPRHYMAGSGSVQFNPGTSPWNGFSTTMSSLTLQPFEEPIVSVPGYGLPGQAASLLLNDPVAAPPATAQPETHAATGFSPVPASSNATPTDIPAWLLATSTGLLMLVAAGHFVRATTRSMLPDS